MFRKGNGQDSKNGRHAKSSWKTVKLYYYGLICNIRKLNYCYVQLLSYVRAVNFNPKI